MTIDNTLTAWDRKRAARQAMIRQMFEPGVSATRVAALLGVSQPTVARDFRAMGWPVGKAGAPKGTKWSHRHPTYKREFRAAVLQAVQAEPHRSMQSFGDQFGVTRERIRQIVTGEMGAPKPNTHVIHGNATRQAKAAKSAAVKQARADKAAQRAAQMLALQKRGYTWERIAGELGVHFQTVARGFRYAKTHGITVSP